MEYVSGGELSDYIIAKKRIREDEACRLFQQIICAIEYLHENGIAHRDLKPENILLKGPGEYLVCDFGCSKVIRDLAISKNFFRLSYSKGLGTPEYAAP